MADSVLSKKPVSKKVVPKTAAGVRRGRVAPTGRFAFFHPAQKIYIPVTGVEVEIDPWVERQIELRALKEL